jgi:hypothetical protein
MKSTVLILGAGASAHLGYPVRPKLITEICRKLKDEKYDTHVTKAHADQLDDFTSSLSNGCWSSIDAFLEANRNYLTLGKRLITEHLTACEKPEPLSEPNDVGWYKTLFRAILTQDPGEIPKGPLSIITFNYDRSLECFLFYALRGRYGLNAAKAGEILAALKIVHPHGILGAYPEVPYSNAVMPKSFDQRCEGIKIVHEFEGNENEFVSKEFENANALLEDAERIIFLGFGFHGDNISRLRFFEPAAFEGREVVSTHMLPPNPGGVLDGMLAHVADFGFNKKHFRHYASCNEFSITTRCDCRHVCHNAVSVLLIVAGKLGRFHNALPFA